MFFDEFHFHRRRGLPLWERIGHPIDTLSVLACLLLALLCPFSTRLLRAYIALAAASCLLVTKDEFVHARYCSPGEHWVHALSFILHPLVLIAAAAAWPAIHDAAALPWPRAVLSVQAAVTALFMAYQAVYWNLLWRAIPLEEKTR